MTDSALLNAAKAARADLQGILPDFEPSGDRTHPAWKTIEELKAAIEQAPLRQQPAEARLQAAAPAMLEKLKTIAELRRRWRSQDDAETIDSIAYMDCLDDIELEATIAAATTEGKHASQLQAQRNSPLDALQAVLPYAERELESLDECQRRDGGLEDEVAACEAAVAQAQRVLAEAARRHA